MKLLILRLTKKLLLYNKTQLFTVNKTQTSGPNPVTAAGDVIGYTIAVVNTGNVSLNNIVITDVMPDGSTGVLGLPNESLVTDGVLNVAETWIYPSII